MKNIGAYLTKEGWRQDYFETKKDVSDSCWKVGEDLFRGALITMAIPFSIGVAGYIFYRLNKNKQNGEKQ